jgi:hypothetical protein
MYLPPLEVKVLVPTSEEEPQVWRFTTAKPADEWTQPDFDDKTWPEGPGGFGAEGTPGIKTRTEWRTSDIWLRRAFDLKSVPASPSLRLDHDEDCEVFINGKPVSAAKGHVTSYIHVPLTDPSALKSGRNVLAIHCRQTGGGQGIDVGLVEVIELAGR